ncbi:methylated-DNA--[protein]-cysteine S-methyltransferase [Pelagibius sp. Alg239-R121]|uniref:methylated-DNA--[protein]-cysteine S-methyltransferase n=1 Tax=Pelagibius sp. Alg239-R121 TaxID=2993448 RepID=UPI0024A6F40E|nr:methylated-DNA--[protein]-cysteine S-methyltransferase [Pelagibius sp. Alg239-R121]
MTLQDQDSPAMDTVETTLASPFGDLFLRVSDEAITRLTWLMDNDQLRRSDPTSIPIQPSGANSPNRRLLEEAVRQLQAYFDGQLRDFTLPLAPAGTKFQQRVWFEMAKIPYGQTMTYGQLAHKSDTVARAVGGACGSNPIPIIIPCHRVLGGGGKLGGFSGGLGPDSKRSLLEHEGVLTPGLGF